MKAGLERGFSSEQIKSEILEMCRETIEMLQRVREGFRRQDSRPLEMAEESAGRSTHERRN